MSSPAHFDRYANLAFARDSHGVLVLRFQATAARPQRWRWWDLSRSSWPADAGATRARPWSRQT